MKPSPRIPAPPDDVAAVMQTLCSHGYQAYLVGGCVRDGLRGLPIHDYDVATEALPEQVLSLFPRTFATGLRHGTVTVVTEHRSVEVTTFRVESVYSDGRRPDKVEFTHSLEQDLARRDFTVNAMAADLEGHLIDPFGGWSDLVEQRLRAVGNPEQRFAEDGLRILRALRFVSQLAFTIEPRTAHAMHMQAERLRSVSGERIGQEMKRIAETMWWQAWPLWCEGPWLRAYPNPWPGWADALYAAADRIGDDESSFEAFGRRWRQTLQDLHWADAWAPVVAWMFWVGHIVSASTEEIHEAIRRFGWPKSVAQQLRRMLAVSNPDPLSWTQTVWRQRLFETPAPLVGWVCFVLDVLVPGQASRFARYQEMAPTQPLHGLSALAVNGHDLAALGLRGREIGETLTSLARMVLNQDLTNERSVLLQWVMDDLASKGRTIETQEGQHDL
ncbi:CCA tRNA nucleotidyltransferase [Alicyclobacillus herbarius]|uniref:CCA tRNA nucleotidyltransferase n=1 Tax=Alicyclobacillus herbarius TaxID=122960 RepID=UPI0003FF6B5D|nr:CCA tRNA nucleotidyltransferase [Alicyclobacillus herbarius]